MGDAFERRHELACRPVLNRWNEYLRFRDGLVAVLDPELYNPEWLDMMVWSGQFMLFTTENCVILASIKVYPTGVKELHGELAFGNLRDIVHMAIPSAIDFARSQGCKIATISSREGWSRMLKKQGFNLHQTTIRKVL